MTAINAHGNELEFRSAVEAAAQDALKAELRIHETYTRELMEAEGLECSPLNGAILDERGYRIVHEMQGVEPHDGVQRTAHRIRLYKLISETPRYTVDVDREPRVTLTLPDKEATDGTL